MESGELRERGSAELQLQLHRVMEDVEVLILAKRCEGEDGTRMETPFEIRLVPLDGG